MYAKTCPSCERSRGLIDFVQFGKQRRVFKKCKSCRTPTPPHERALDAIRQDEERKAKQKLSRERQKPARQKRIRDRRERMYNYLLDHPCVDCGETNPLILEFDHIEPDQKEFGVMSKVDVIPWEKLFLEIEKCVVRCANCHRIRTHEQRNTIFFNIWTTRQSKK